MRDQHGVALDDIRDDLLAVTKVLQAITGLRDTDVIYLASATVEVMERLRKGPPAGGTSIDPDDPDTSGAIARSPGNAPPTLVHWVRRQVALHSVARDHHAVLTEPDVTLGVLRAWLRAIDP